MFQERERATLVISETQKIKGLHLVLALQKQGSKVRRRHAKLMFSAREEGGATVKSLGKLRRTKPPTFQANDFTGEPDRGSVAREGFV